MHHQPVDSHPPGLSPTSDRESAAVRFSIAVNGIVLSGVDYGGSGPDVLLLHGLAGRAEEWETTAAWLTERFRVVAIDQRGHGESTKGCGDFSRAAYVADAAAVIADLHLGPCIVIGQSMGALTAYLLAARHPSLVRALVLIESGITNDPDSPDRIGAWLDSWPVPFPDRPTARRFFGGETLAAKVWSEALVRDRGGFGPSFRRADMIASVRDFEAARSYEREWTALLCPTLLVLGERGWIADADVDRMRSLKPDLAVVTVPDAGHDLHLDNPSGWRAAAEPFLRQFLSGRESEGCG